MADTFIQRVEMLTFEEKKSVQELLFTYNEERNVQFKLDPSVLENINDHRVCHFLQWNGKQLTAYMVSNYFNEIEMEITFVGMNEMNFPHFIELASLEAKRNGLTKLLLIVDEMDKQANEILGKQGFSYEFSEYRLVFQHDFSFNNTPSTLVMREATASDKSIISDLDFEGFGTRDDITHIDISYTQLAIVDQKVIGKIRLEQVDHTVGIYGFVVFGDQRGKGYGTQMLSHIVQESQSKGISLIYLEVALDNPSALKLYEQCGFQKQARFDYYGTNI